MSDAEYPELKVVEASAPCPVLARLPRLPVSVLVLEQEGATGEGRPLAARLTRLADEFGVGAGLQVAHHAFSSWPALEDEPPRGRYDAVFLHITSLPADSDDPRSPRSDVLELTSRLLANLEVRFYVVARTSDADTTDRRMGLLLSLVERGAPPAVLLPAEWTAEEVSDFEEALFERILHDAPLVQAAATATGELRPLPTIYQPPGRRHGLDLGRLLEDHRRRIEEGGNALRILRREVEAFRPGEDEASHASAWQEIADDVSGAQDALDGIKHAVEEINRDRDPAGWSRLADSIAALRDWEGGVQQDRDRLDAFREVAYGDPSRG